MHRTVSYCATHAVLKYTAQRGTFAVMNQTYMQIEGERQARKTRSFAWPQGSLGTATPGFPCDMPSMDTVQHWCMGSTEFYTTTHVQSAHAGIPIQQHSLVQTCMQVKEEEEELVSQDS